MSKNWDCLNKNNPEKTAVGKTGGDANTWCPRAKSKPSDNLSVNKSGDSVDASQCKKVLHIIIPVAGTTDPVNMDDITSRAVSYSSTIDGKEIRYWDKCFVNDLEKLREANKNIIIFPFHGWTGDNRIKNREIAGAYLVNRLCGAESQTNNAYYGPTYQKKDIHFHLVGHSHGGNVINEMTKQIAKIGSAWPATWKIKSLVYLSTPFFNSIHQLKHSGTLSDAKVLNLYNEFDMTQRMLADFSMEALANAIHGMDFKAINDAVAELESAINVIPFENLKEFRWQRGGARMMNRQAGLDLYSATIKSLDKFNDVLTEVLKFIKSLTGSVEYKSSSKITHDGKRITAKHRLITDEIYERFETIFQRLQSDIDSIITPLKGAVRNTRGDFDKADYIGTLFGSRTFLLHLNDLLDIDSESLVSRSRPSIWTLLAQILQQNIELFDNTYSSPKKQIKALSLQEINVTRRDFYYGTDGSKYFNSFVKRIEAIEARCDAKPNEHDLLDLLCVLIANVDMAYTQIIKYTAFSTKIDHLEYIATGTIDAQLKQLRHTLENISAIFQSRHVAGGLIDTKDSAKHEMEKRGSLMYLLEHSHSTSRRCMHKEVKEFLERQTSC